MCWSKQETILRISLLGSYLVNNLSRNIYNKAGNKLVPNKVIPDISNTIAICNSDTLIYAAAYIFHEHMGSRDTCIDHRSLEKVHDESNSPKNIELTHILFIFQISLLVLVSYQFAPFTAFSLAAISC